jgi:hypothetical protein
VPNTPCTAVDFASGDQLYGPVYSNDSIFISGNPTFTGTVNTADPQCLFVDYTQTGCAQDNGNYTVLGSGDAHTKEPLPTDDSELAAVAKQGGCFYQGPTSITLSVTQVAGVNVGQMKVVSPDTLGYPGNDTMNAATPVGDPNCPTDSIATASALPSNGVLFVNQATGTPLASVNPLYSTTDTSQVQSACANCYYGQSGNPGAEADAFVQGSLSGHLTIAAYNNVIIDGSITYKDCNWSGTPSESLCAYNNATTASGINDTLGLIANNFVEVDQPVQNDGHGNGTGTTLPPCAAPSDAPLCNPSATGNNAVLTIDATILALNQSFAVNNYGPNTTTNDGTLNIYGSIQQNARGAVAQNGGYTKYYLYDPRLTLYGPPYYLTPGTPSWTLESSAESYTGSCPVMPPPQQTPAALSAAPTWPWPTPPAFTATDPVGSNCLAAP